MSGPPSAAEIEERWEKGLAAYSKLFGIVPSEVFATLSRRSGRRMATEAVLSAGSGVWDDDTLTIRERRIAVIAALVTQGAVERLDSHLRRAFEEGLSLADFEALMHLLALYAGFPRATIAMNAARTQLVEMGVLPESEAPA